MVSAPPRRSRPRPRWPSARKHSTTSARASTGRRSLKGSPQQQKRRGELPAGPDRAPRHRRPAGPPTVTAPGRRARLATTATRGFRGHTLYRTQSRIYDQKQRRRRGSPLSAVAANGPCPARDRRLRAPCWTVISPRPVSPSAARHAATATPCGVSRPVTGASVKLLTGRSAMIVRVYAPVSIPAPHHSSAVHRGPRRPPRPAGDRTGVMPNGHIRCYRGRG